MSNKAHKPPSRMRYELAHPTISVRVTRELYDRLKELKRMSGKTLGDVLREALKRQDPSVKDAYSRGYRDGEVRYSVRYKCSVCGGNLVAGSDKEKTAIAQYMREHGWGHSGCIRKSA